MQIQTINPATGEMIKRYETLSRDEVNKTLDEVQSAYLDWREINIEKRSQQMRAAGAVLLSKKKELAKLMTTEMGKPITQARMEIEKCAQVCDFYAQRSQEFLTQEIIESDAQKSFISFQPLGIILAVMPWNFPFWQVFRFAAPSLMAGNACVLKHASNVSGCALAIEDIFKEAGFPENVFRTLIIDTKQVEDVIGNPLIKAVTLTGSTFAGQAVAAKAGSVLKKTVLELGGSDPYVILEDADLAQAAAICVNSRLINSGQSCIAAKRFIVVDKVKLEFEKLFVKEMKNKLVGDPLKENTEVGPLARFDLRDQLHKQVKDSIKKGAKLLLGGVSSNRKGAFYSPTILTNVKKGMPAYDEELFGPVAAIISAKNEEDALLKANDSVFGLGAAVFTQNLKKGEEIAETQLEAGCCFVNAHVKSDPRLPFGGIKESGYGRELSSFGIREFVNIKTVYIK